MSFIATGGEACDAIKLTLSDRPEDWFVIKHSVSSGMGMHVARFHRQQLKDWQLGDPPTGDDYYGSKFLIGSRMLSPWIDSTIGEQQIRTEPSSSPLDLDLLTNGLIYLYRGGFNTSGELMETDLAIVNEVKNKVTGEVLLHREYGQVFDRMKRSISRDLLCSACFLTPDGKVIEDKTLKWSKGALENAARGAHYRYRVSGHDLRGGHSG